MPDRATVTESSRTEPVPGPRGRRSLVVRAVTTAQPGTTALLWSLYVTQYLGLGFIFTGLPGILRDGGASLDALAVIQALGLAWAAKFLWAPLVDRFRSAGTGHYRGWLLVLQPLMVAVLVAMVPLGSRPLDIGPILALAVAFTLFSATQDIAADAIAVRVIPAADRGPANAIQIAGGYVGNLIGGGAAVIVYDHWGWAAAMGWLAALTSLAMIAVVRFREPPTAPSGASVRGGYASMLDLVRRPGAALWVFAAIPATYMGLAMIQALLAPALIDAGWSLTRVGLVTGALIAVPSIVGALVAGGLIVRFGRTVTLISGLVTAVAGNLMVMPVFVGHAALAPTSVAVVVYMAGFSVIATVVHTVNMDLSRPESAGTEFTTLSAVALTFSFIAAGVGLATAERLGYPAVALAGGLLQVGGVLMGVRYQRRYRARTETGHVRESADDR